MPTSGPCSSQSVTSASPGRRAPPSRKICKTPHWFVSLRGELEVVPVEGEALHLSPGQAAYVPGGAPGHRFHADGPVTAAGFAPKPPRAIEEAEIRAAGFVVERSADLWVPDEQREDHPDRRRPADRPATRPDHMPTPRSWAPGSPVERGSEARPAIEPAGVTCLTGAWSSPEFMAIEWEDDLETVRAGDAYHCPPGPPGASLRGSRCRHHRGLHPGGGRGSRKACRHMAPHSSGDPGDLTRSVDGPSAMYPSGPSDPPTRSRLLRGCNASTPTLDAACKAHHAQ